MDLTHAPFYTDAIIQNIQGSTALQTRLSELGLNEGCRIQLIQKIPFGGPYILSIENSLLALRYEEAQCIQIKI